MTTIQAGKGHVLTIARALSCTRQNVHQTVRSLGLEDFMNLVRGEHGLHPLFVGRGHAPGLGIDLASVRQRIADGDSNPSIARDFGVTPQYICMIRKGKRP